MPLPLPEIAGYEILGELGKGGMGVVFKAVQTAADRIVALKMILGGFADDEARARFRNEAHAVARLQHPNVVQVFEVGEHRGVPFFSLEFCAGGSLEGRLSATPLPAAEAAKLVETLARAMHAAHGQNIVHRDLKPANVLLAADGTPKIADFGLAKKLDDAGKTSKGAIMGSPPYMAPEQAAGRTEAIGPLTDVYALGAILYECLTGRPPFKAATAMETLVQVINDEPVAPRQLQPGTPRDLETICLKCLRKEPGGRYANALELAEDLRRFQAGEPIRARPVGSAERLALWARRRPVVASLTAGVAASLLLGIAASTSLAVAAYRWATTAEASAADARAKTKLAREAQTAAETSAADARAKTEQVREESARTEVAVAHGLLRPLGHGDGPVNDIELDALWEAAGGTNERVRRLFIESALETPARARQLRNRRELALHAIVGLDRGRRDAVEKLLLDRMRDPQAPPELRADCALIGTALGDVRPDFAAEAARILAEAIPRAAVADLPAEIEGLHAYFDKQPEADAARSAAVAANALLAALAPDKTRTEIRRPLSDVADKLDPQAANQVAHGFSDLLAGAEYDFRRNDCAEALLTVLDRAAPDDQRKLASRAAQVLAAGIEKTIDEALKPPKDELFPGAGQVDLMPLAGETACLRRLGDKLDPKERKGIVAPVERRLADAVVKTTQFLQYNSFGSALEELPPLLDPDAAASTIQSVLTDRSQEGLRKRAYGGKVLESVARAAAPGGGVVVAAGIERSLTGRFSAFDVEECLGAMRAALNDMPPEEAAPHARQFADRMMLAINVMDEAQYLIPLTDALLAVAPRLDAEHAELYRRFAAQQLVAALAKADSAYDAARLAAAVADAAPTMSDRKKAAEYAVAAAGRLSEMANKTDDPGALSVMAQAPVRRPRRTGRRRGRLAGRRDGQNLARRPAAGRGAGETGFRRAGPAPPLRLFAAGRSGPVWRGHRPRPERGPGPRRDGPGRRRPRPRLRGRGLLPRRRRRSNGGSAPDGSGGSFQRSLL